MRASDIASPQGSNVHCEEIIIVGAGQAGLSIGYWLKRQQRSFLLPEAGPRIGESWRQRVSPPWSYSRLAATARCPAWHFRAIPQVVRRKTSWQTTSTPMPTTLRFPSRWTHGSWTCRNTKRHSCCTPHRASIKQRPSSWQRGLFTIHASRHSPRRSRHRSSSFTQPRIIIHPRFLRVPSWSWEQAIPARISRRNWLARMRCLWLLPIRCILSHLRCWAKASSGTWIPCAS